MNKKSTILILVFLILSIVSSSCSKSMVKEDFSAAKAIDNDYDTSDGSAKNREAKEATADSVSGNNEKPEAVNNSLNNAIISQRKIIRNANITISVENFDKSYNQLKQIVSPIGYIESSQIRSNNYDEDNKEYTSGTITIRIDKDKFDSFHQFKIY